MLTDGQTDGWTDDGQKVITIAHPEHSSGELKRNTYTQQKKQQQFIYFFLSFYIELHVYHNYYQIYLDSAL